MKCICGRRIDIKKVAAEMGKKGGAKSKRVLTSDQAREMAYKRHYKKNS